MVKIQLNSKGEWEKLPPYSKEGVYINEKLFNVMLNILRIINQNWDCIFLIDGIEGSGKSIFAIFLAWVLSKGKLTIKNIAENSDDAINKLEILKDKSILVIDEGSLSFSSKEVMKKEQIKLIKILNVIRQKNMILIIVSPSFFDLNKYIAVHRSRFLLHVYTDKKMKRGRFCYFSTKQKRILYEIGKKNFNSYSRPRSKFNGNFIDWKPPFYEEYLKIKKKSLISALKKDLKNEKARTRVDYYSEIAVKLQRNLPELRIKDLARGFGLSISTLKKYLMLGKKAEKERKKEEEKEEEKEEDYSTSN